LKYKRSKKKENKMKTFLQILQIIVVGVFIYVLVWGYFNIALPLQEKNECQKWIRESSIYPNYYFTEWQKEQCERYGYDVSKIPVLEKK